MEPQFLEVKLQMSLVWHHCVLKDPQRTLQTTEEKMEHRIACDGVCHTTETAKRTQTE